MHSCISWKRLAVLGLLMSAVVCSVEANERKFTYTYESGVLPPGQRELEFWTTWRVGRADYYSRFDHRAEFEFGVTDRLMTSVYLNWEKITQQDPADPRGTVTAGAFKGISSEWKYKLLDPVADPVGLALYQEYSVDTDEFEWESKLILDKKIGNTLIAYNFVVEPEWEFNPGHTDYELGVENDLGVTQFFTPRFSAGFEVRNHNEKTKASTGFEHSALFIGPVVSYARENWWVTATILKQLPALKKSINNPQDNLILDEHEKLNVRILASIRI